MNFLALIPVKDWLYGGAIAILLMGFGLFVHHERGIGAAKVEAIRTAEHAAQAAVAASAIAKNQTETTRRIAATMEIIHATEVSASAVAADASAAAAARDAARVQLSAYVHRNAVPSNSAAASGVPAAADPDVLLAGLLDEAWGRSLDLAGEAEKRRTAGVGCQQQYRSLTP